LESTATDWSRVLDLYAGTGALGIESLSRGAAWADLVERDPRCCAAIKRNLREAGLAGQAHVYCCSVAKALTFLRGKYGIIFMDPPYADPSLKSQLGDLAASELIDEAFTTIVVLHSCHLPLDSAYAKFHVIKERYYGDTCVSIYQAGNRICPEMVVSGAGSAEGVSH